MRKIISLFERNHGGDNLVRNEIVKGAEWVVEGEGTATRKWDGTCCMIRNGVLYKRYDAKNGKTPPAGFEPAQDPDPKTGHWPGWLWVSNDDPADKWHREAFNHLLADSTYELVGPKVQGNPEGFPIHVLIRHGDHQIPGAPRSFHHLKDWFIGKDIEGIVWHRWNGDMVKIKKGDFGLRRSE